MKLEVNLDDRNEIAKAFQLLGNLLGVKLFQRQGADAPTGEPAASEPTAGSGDSAPASTVAAPATPTPAAPESATSPDSGAPRPPSEEPAKKVRKPRADAGKPRGSYKNPETNGAAQAAASGETSAVAAAPTPAAGVASQPAPAAEGAGSSPAGASSSDEYFAEITARNAAARASVQAPAAATKKLTHDDMRETLALINKVPGLGMPGCHAFLAAFTPTGAAAPGVKRISDIPEADFPRFTAEVRARIERFEKERK